MADGCIHLIADPSAGLAYTDLLAGGDLDEVTADGEVTPQAIAAGMPPAGAFGAHFAEVRVDEDLGLVHVTRMTSAVDAGRILNEKLARSQILGAVVMGIGMTLFEETVFDPATGRIANPTFADYLIPVSADVPDLDVIFVGEPDRSNPVGVKGLGRSASSACPPPSPTPCTTPPAGAYARCRSPSTSCCSAAAPAPSPPVGQGRVTPGPGARTTARSVKGIPRPPGTRKAMLETRDVPGATELEAPSRRPPIRGVNETPTAPGRSPPCGSSGRSHPSRAGRRSAGR